MRFRHLLAPTILTAMFLLTTGCSSDGDDNPTGPGGGGAAEPTHCDITVKMSSIFAQENCNAGSNAGDFRWRLIVRTPTTAETCSRSKTPASRTPRSPAASGTAS